jgi:hypothetical protein
MPNSSSLREFPFLLGNVGEQCRQLVLPEHIEPESDFGIFDVAEQ